MSFFVVHRETYGVFEPFETLQEAQEWVNTVPERPSDWVIREGQSPKPALKAKLREQNLALAEAFERSLIH